MVARRLQTRISSFRLKKVTYLPRFPSVQRAQGKSSIKVQQPVAALLLYIPLPFRRFPLSLRQQNLPSLLTMLKSAGRFFTTRYSFLNDPSHFSVAFAFHHHTFPYTVLIFPSTSTLFDRTIQAPPSCSPHSSAFSPPPTSTGTVVTMISSASPLSKSKAPISSP